MKSKTLTINNISIELENDKSKTKILDSITLDVFQSEILGLIGKTGSGKSMLAKTVLGLIKSKNFKKRGKVLFHKNTKNKILNQGIQVSMIFQEPTKSLNPVHSVGKQFRIILKKQFGYEKRRCQEMVNEWFEKVHLIPVNSFIKRYPHQLSGGQMQRVMIAIAMAVRPSLLVADEITTALDANLKNEILDLVFSLIKESKTAVLLISHDLHLIKSYCDRIAVMEKGSIVEINKTKNIFTNPKAVYTKNIIKTLFIVNDKEVYKSSKPDKPVIVIQNISKTYNVFGNPIRALNKINLNILSREVLGIIGQSGSGKSTLVKILLQVLHQDEGVIKMIDDSSREIIHERPNNEFGVVFQDSLGSLNPKMKIFDSLAEPLILKGITSRESIEEKIDGIIKQTSIKDSFLYRYPHQLSGGQRQRVAIARSLITEPRFLILDEPTSSLDIHVQKKILKLIKKIKEYNKITVMLISHDLKSMVGLVDRIAVLYKGQIVEQGKTDEILYNPNIQYTKNLVSTIYN